MAFSSAGPSSPAWLVAVLVAVAVFAGPAAAQGAELEVDFPDAGHGRVTSDIGGLDCPPTCTVQVPDGSTVTLTGTPATGYVLGRADQQGLPEDDSGWEGCEEVPGDRSRCTVEVEDGTTFVDVFFRPAALLLVVANGGEGAVRAQVSNPASGEIDDRTCDSANDGGKVCPYAYLPGRAVTLTALPGSAPFRHWSDDDCGTAPTCTVVLDEPRTSVTATYGTQHVFVQVWGPGRVTSTPAGIDCEVTEPDGFNECSTVVPTGQDVALTADGADPRWVTDPAPERAGCDSTFGAVCHVFAERSRWTVVSFAGVPAQDQYPPKAGVNFKVRKAGDGQGTVRGGGIDCGSRCRAEASFGDRVVLSADAAAGSTFVRWRGGCGDRARCGLTVGPTTRVTAVFARAATTATVLPDPKPKVKKLRAALKRVRVKRVRGRRYRVVMPLRLNLAAKVTARVMTRRGRRLVRRTWQSPPGNHRLRLRVSARKGRYRLIVRLQTADGQVRRIKRPLRLR